jgi:hypothetical protein
MSTRDPAGTGPPDAPAPESSDVDAIRDEIEHTREDLGDTVAALSAKTDVKAQASAKAEELKQRARDVGGEAKQRANEVAGQVKQRPAPAIVGGVALVMVLWFMRRRRRGRRGGQALEPLSSLAYPVRAIVVEPSNGPGG